LLFAAPGFEASSSARGFKHCQACIIVLSHRRAALLVSGDAGCLKFSQRVTIHAAIGAEACHRQGIIVILVLIE
jgi:hypothetical protein